MRAAALWATPIIRDRLSLNKDQIDGLVSIVMREDAKNRGTRVGTVNATKTESDLLTLHDAELVLLREVIVDVERAMLSALNIDSAVSGVGILAEAWGVVYHDWGSHRIHSHHDSAWSGVLYLDMGSSDDSAGLIEFRDPRAAASARNPHEPSCLAIKPQSGELILFPSWLEHWVTPHVGERPRIVIAFNVGYRE